MVFGEMCNSWWDARRLARTMKHLLSIAFVTLFFVQGHWEDPVNDIDLTFTDYEHWFKDEAECLAHVDEALSKLDIMVYIIDSPTMTRTAGCYTYEFTGDPDA